MIEDQRMVEQEEYVVEQPLQERVVAEQMFTFTEKYELIDLVRLRKLLSYTKTNDKPAYQELSFYYECFADRHEQYDTEIRVQYLPSKRMSEYKFGRIYGQVSSFFSDSKRYGGLQTMKKNYRSYLCENTHFDVDLVNAHPSILIGLLLNMRATPPDLLHDYVHSREDLLAKIVQLFGVSNTQNKSIAKKLMLRLMYGGTVFAWMTEFRIDPRTIDQSHPLFKKLEQFPSKLNEVSQVLFKLPKFEEMKRAFEHTRTENEEPKMVSFLSLILEETEKQILFFADSYLTKNFGRKFDVLIHDGGLIQRASQSETHLPIQMLRQLNLAIQDNFDLPMVKFIQKPFDLLPLKEVIEKEPQLYLEFGYSKWKHYLEEHLDLCYMSKDKSFLFADNKQTHVYKKEDLRTATAEYSVWANTVLSHQQGVDDDEEVEDEEEKKEEEQKREAKPQGTKKIYFIDVWFRDPTRKRFDMIYFSEKTALRDNTVSFLTPIAHAKKFKPKYRYIFQGFDLMQEPFDPESSHQPFLDFLSKILPKKQVYDYVLNWIAHIFQYPDTRLTGTCLCILSRIQGSGKSTLLEILLNLLGRYGMKINNPKQQLFDNFTHAMEHHLLLAIDDSDSTVLREKAEDFKNLITSDDARIREMYNPERTVFSNVRFLLISNNTSVINMDENSRRFAVVEPSSELAGDHSYFVTFRHQYWACVKNRRATLNYLLNQHRIPDKWHPEASYPVSTLKKKMEAANLNLLSCYIYSLCQTLLSEPQLKHYDFLDVQSTQLKNKFTEWVTTTADKKKKTAKPNIPNRNEFPVELDKIGVKNTRDLPSGPEKKWHQSGQWYRLLLKQFAQKADDYELDLLDSTFHVKGEFFVKSAIINNGLSANLPAEERKKKTTKTIFMNANNQITTTPTPVDKDGKMMMIGLTRNNHGIHSPPVASSLVISEHEQREIDQEQRSSTSSKESVDWTVFMKQQAKEYRKLDRKLRMTYRRESDKYHNDLVKKLVQQQQELMARTVINQNNFYMMSNSSKLDHSALEAASTEKKKIQREIDSSTIGTQNRPVSRVPLSHFKNPARRKSCDNPKKEEQE